MSKMTIAIGAVIVAVVVVVAAVVYLAMPKNGTTGDSSPKATIAGTQISWKQMQDNYGERTVDGNTGVSLSDIVNGTGLSTPGTNNYKVEGLNSDGTIYTVVVNWSVMQSGILTQQTPTSGDNTTPYLMSYFPGLPSAYKVKYLVDIVPSTSLTPIVLNGMEFYMDYMPKRVGQKTLVYNDTYNATGFSLSDMVNYTSLASPEAHSYTIIASDGFMKNVTWANMMDGVVVPQDTKTVFLGLTKGYMVKNLVRIDVI